MKIKAATSNNIILLLSLIISSLHRATPYRVSRNFLRGTFAELSSDQPVMHTFFAELSPVGRGRTSAGMTTDAHMDMIRTWQNSWQNAGWNTRILTMKEVMQHPEFDQIDAMIQNFKMNEYEKSCYYRWLAMAAVGGGWMSDYDTLPLHNFSEQGLNLPNQGAFTAYEMHVPSLLSGSASEWTRMIRRLVEYASTHVMDNELTPSDMHSLLGLKLTYPSIFIHRLQVSGGSSLPEGDIWTEEHCQRMVPRNMRAIHFSHAMIDRNWIPNHPNDKLNDSPTIAHRWLENLLSSCG